MLKYLDIHNLAIINELSMTLDWHLSVVTGETGAGKSIMVDLLKLALGQRADTRWLKNSEQKGEVTATFDISDQPKTRQWLQDQELANGNVCIMRRVIKPNRSSRCFINQTPVPLHMAQTLGQLLVNIHSQHQYQNLTQYHTQRQYVDDYGSYSELLATVQNAYWDWKHCHDQLKHLEKAQQAQREREQLLHYQIEELEALALQPGQVESLEQEHRQLAHAEELINYCQQSTQLLSDSEHAAGQAVLSACQHIKKALDITQDTDLQNTLQMLENAHVQITEADHELSQKAQNIRYDPERLQQVKQQLSQIYDVARKHRVEPEDLPTLLQQLTTERDQLQQTDQDVEYYRNETQNKEQHYLQKARELTEKRQNTANQLSQALVQHLHKLAMPNAEVVFRLQPLASYQPEGVEQIQMVIRTNPGQNLEPLHLQASGGELSRISLALQALVNQGEGTHTLIFDEVDVGIGGQTATVVGRMLAKLAEHRQVLCITHLPQVASFGHHHFNVQKLQANQQTNIQVNALFAEQRVEEVARMMGGIEVTEQSRAHAEQLLGMSN